MSDLALILSGGGGAAIIWATVALLKTFLSRKLVNADAADRLAGSAVEMIREARDDAAKSIAEVRNNAALSVTNALQDVANARREASEARGEAAEARRAANEARREAEASNLFTRRLITELFRPDASIERLRRMVNEGGGETAAMNGARI